MINFYNKYEVRRKIKELNFINKKSLGQNFLVDQNICEKIVNTASASFRDGVIEIGPGLGVLTESLSKKFKKVVSIEIDDKLFDFLFDTFKDHDNVNLVNADALAVDIEKLIYDNFSECKSIVMCSNLPYCITTPILMKFLECRKINQITVMIQKEAADRILSDPGTRNCGAISTAVRFYSNPKFNFNVPNTCFVPAPKVESSVVSFEITNRHENINKKAFFSIVKSAFAKRRKNILNSISSGLHIEKSKILAVLKLCELDKNLRAENLKLDDYINLSNFLFA